MIDVTLVNLLPNYTHLFLRVMGKIMPIYRPEFVTHNFWRLSRPPFLEHPSLDPACSPFLKSFFPLVSFLFHPLLRYFRQFPSPSRRQTLFFPSPTHQPSLHIIYGIKQISKGWFYQFTCCCLSKTNFELFKALNKYIRLS